MAKSQFERRLQKLKAQTVPADTPTKTWVVLFKGVAGQPDIPYMEISWSKRGVSTSFCEPGVPAT
jgi:hypothetical protein